MIWQAFVDAECTQGVTMLHPLYYNFDEAKRARVNRYREVLRFCVNQTSRLRRVGWFVEPGVEAACELRWAMQSTSVAVVGRDRAVEWTSLDLPEILCGTNVCWLVVPSGLDGRAVFTFDFESI